MKEKTVDALAAIAIITFLIVVAPWIAKGVIVYLKFIYNF